MNKKHDNENDVNEENDKTSDKPKKVEAVLEEVKNEEVKNEEPKSETDKVKELEKELTEFKNKYYRALADYQNLQRRTAKEQLEARGRGAEDFVKKLLPVLDTLDKAMEQLSKVQVDKKIMDGLEMFSIQFTDVLEKEGLKSIIALGSKFDPNFHEALNKRNEPETEDEIVLDVYEKGYTFKDRVLRSAKVVINQL